MTELRFESDQADDDGVLYGRIQIGTLDEGFGATASPWTAADYRAHWRRALQAALGGKDVALITDWRPAQRPSSASGQAFLVYWVDGAVAIQNKVLLGAAFQTPARPSPETVVLGPRRSTNDSGAPISEWRASRADLEALLAAL